MKPGEGSTQIGRSIVIRGELTGAEDLYLDGSFEGTITLSESRLTVGPNAHITADLKVRDIVVHGVVDGNIQASGRLELRQSATVHGDVLAARLSIEESATLRGRVELVGHPLSSAATPDENR